MDRIYYTPSKFTRSGDKFDIDSRLGGTFTVEFVGKTPDGLFRFHRKKVNDWPAADYTYTEEQVSKEVFHLVPDKYDRLVMKDESREKYERMLADPHIDRVETR
jgi:hypothetical protein